MRYALLLLFLFPACALSEEKPCFPVDRVLKVVDGDTADVSLQLEPFSIYYNIRVRMQGINAWESRTRNLEEKELGLAAKARLTELMSGPVMVCTNAQGKFGRWLGVFLDANGNSINQQMVDEGHAHYYDGGKRKQF